MTHSRSRFTSVIAFLAISTLVTLTAAAQTVTVGSKSVKCGQTFDVPVTTSSVSGLEGFRFNVGYDASKLEIKDATKGSLTDDFLVDKNLGANPLLVLGAGTPVSGSGSIAILRFAAKASASGTVPLTISNVQLNDVPKSGNNGSVTITCLQPPSAPTLASPANGATNVAAPVTLKWNAVSGADEYVVWFGTPSAAEIGTTSSTSLQVETATGTTYEWYVRAKNDAGTSPSSAKRTFTTSGPFCATPGAPVLSAPTSATAGTAYNLTWAPVASATEYVVEEASSPAFSDATSTTTAATLASFTKSPASDTTFYYRVRARNTASGCNATGPFSNTVAVSVSPKPPIPPGGAVLIVVSSTPGEFDAMFRTSLQLYNPTGGVLRGRIVFHLAGTSGGDSDPSLPWELQPGHTLSYADLLPALGVPSGAGSVDLVPDPGFRLPLFVTRIFNDAGAKGTSGMTLDALGLDDVLYAGDTGVIVAPMDPSRSRMNIGIRALAEGASITARMRDRNGAVLATKELSYPAVFFIQVAAESLMGAPLAADATLSFTVNAGSALIYGSTTDNVTNDPNVQIAQPAD